VVAELEKTHTPAMAESLAATGWFFELLKHYNDEISDLVDKVVEGDIIKGSGYSMNKAFNTIEVWEERLFYADLHPEDAARLIERAFRIYKKHLV
jgi:hypothetical protein